MRTILLIVSFIIIFFTSSLFYIGIHDEIYQDIEKNKLWFSDGSFTLSLIFLFISMLCLIYVFKCFLDKIRKVEIEEPYSKEINKLELIKHNKNFHI